MLLWCRSDRDGCGECEISFIVFVGTGCAAVVTTL